MSAIKSKGTSPEAKLAALIKELLPRRKIVSQPPLPGKPDYYLPGLRLALFSDGCFWHGCPTHGRIPDDNREYWKPKLARNRERDLRALRELRGVGIYPVRVWEHDLKGDMLAARRRLRSILKRLSA